MDYHKTEIDQEKEYPVIELQLSGKELLPLIRMKLNSGLPFQFRAQGWSMAPFIRDQDLITLKSLGGQTPKVGEIVAFLRPGSENLVVHRIVTQEVENSFIRGDGIASEPDGWIHISSILGKVTHIERNGRNVRLGLGRERYLIAWLSRAGWLVPLRDWLVKWRNRFMHR